MPEQKNIKNPFMEIKKGNLTGEVYLIHAPPIGLSTGCNPINYVREIIYMRTSGEDVFSLFQGDENIGIFFWGGVEASATKYNRHDGKIFTPSPKNWNLTKERFNDMNPKFKENIFQALSSEAKSFLEEALEQAC
jgi:hypothetical protein